MRIQVELKRDAIPQVVLNKLFKHTGLQATFGFNAVALVDGVPKTLSLLELTRHYLDYQREIVTRRSKYELRQAEKRAHILQGYLIALDNLDAVIALIRGSDDTDQARTGLIETFALSEEQAQAILDLRLSRLTGLARKEIEEEFADLQERIAELRTILGDPARVDGLIREELLEVKQIYGKGDDRRTEIVAGEDSLELEDMIAEEDMVIAITRSGYIKRLPVTTYREQRRGGIGVMGMDMKDEDYIEHLFVASTHDYILFFTTVGKVYRLKVHELPLGSRQSKGRAIVNLLPLRQDELIRAVIATRDFKEAKYLVFATKKGVVKKTEFLEYNTPLKADGIIALKMRDDDELIGVRLSDGNDDILMVSRMGQAVRFSEKDVRPMGRPASGVAGMKLRAKDEVIEVDIASDDADLLVVTENGWGKRTRVSEYPVKGRGTMGVKTVQLVEAKGRLAGARIVREGYQVMLISDGGTVIRMSTDGIKRSGRATQGVIVMRLREGEQVSSLAPVIGSDDDELDELGRRPSRVQRPSRRSMATPTDAPLPPRPPDETDNELSAPESQRGISLREGTLADAELSGHTLTEGRLTDLRLVRGSLANADLSRCEVRRVELTGCRGTGSSFAEARITDVAFVECRLDLVSFRFATLERVAFRDCRLEEADFYGATLTSVLFERCPLVGATLSEATLARVELRGCDLEGLKGAERLRGARLPWADIVASAGTFAATLGIVASDEPR